MTFAEQFREARQNAGLSQAALAEVTGIPKRTIEQWEGGHREPTEWTQRLVLKELRSMGKAGGGQTVEKPKPTAENKNRSGA